MGTSAVVTKVLLTNIDAIDWGLLPRALLGLVALLCGNGYIVGINQIYDVDIDAVNKPFLPVAAGKYHHDWHITLDPSGSKLRVKYSRYSTIVSVAVPVMLTTCLPHLQIGTADSIGC